MVSELQGVSFLHLRWLPLFWDLAVAGKLQNHLSATPLRGLTMFLGNCLQLLLVFLKGGSLLVIVLTRRSFPLDRCPLSCKSSPSVWGRQKIVCLFLLLFLFVFVLLFTLFVGKCWRSHAYQADLVPCFFACGSHLAGCFSTMFFRLLMWLFVSFLAFFFRLPWRISCLCPFELLRTTLLENLKWFLYCRVRVYSFCIVE